MICFLYSRHPTSNTFPSGKDLATTELTAIIIWSHNISLPVIFAPVDRSKPLPIFLPVSVMQVRYAILRIANPIGISNYDSPTVRNYQSVITDIISDVQTEFTR